MRAETQSNKFKVGDFWWTRGKILMQITDIVSSSKYPLVGSHYDSKGFYAWLPDGRFTQSATEISGKDLRDLDLVKKETNSKVILKEYIKRKTKGN